MKVKGNMFAAVGLIMILAGLGLIFIAMGNQSLSFLGPSATTSGSTVTIGWKLDTFDPIQCSSMPAGYAGHANFQVMRNGVTLSQSTFNVPSCSSQAVASKITACDLQFYHTFTPTLSGTYQMVYSYYCSAPNLAVGVETRSFTVTSYVVPAPTPAPAPAVVCTEGASRACTASNGCAGTQVCSSNAWGSCSDNVGDNCPASCVASTTCANGLLNVTTCPSAGMIDSLVTSCPSGECENNACKAVAPSCIENEVTSECAGTTLVYKKCVNGALWAQNTTLQSTACGYEGDDGDIDILDDDDGQIVEGCGAMAQIMVEKTRVGRLQTDCTYLYTDKPLFEQESFISGVLYSTLFLSIGLVAGGVFVMKKSGGFK